MRVMNTKKNLTLVMMNIKEENIMNYTTYEEDSRYELYSDDYFDSTEYTESYNESKEADDYE